jgi:hypothetical protein
VNHIRFERRVFKDEDSSGKWGRTARYDALIPVVDGTRLSELLGGDRFPGLRVEQVAPPSRQWLGQAEYEEDGYAVVLDGGCGQAGCCGVFARIEVDDTVIHWNGFWGRGTFSAPTGLSYEFDRGEFETELTRAAAGLPPERDSD